MICCNQDISKTVTALSLKLGRLVDNLVIFFKKSYFFSYCPLQIFGHNDIL